tara:strand:+ start:52 stop:549 length:498 start_codon:yes stop_codon:yes gene_type:complete
MDFSKCSLGLETRIKDKRNFIANCSFVLDQQETLQYSKIDDDKKCEIFGIQKSNIDFITKKKMTGCGEHYYPLTKEFNAKKIIGSDSGWNRIPVSGSNQSYKKTPEHMLKVNKWLEYCNSKGARLYHQLDEDEFNFINVRFEKLREQHLQDFNDFQDFKKLKQLK